MAFCHECGKLVADKAKFCRNCGASQAEALPDTVAAAPVAAPAPEPVAVIWPAPAPEPVAAPAAAPPAAPPAPTPARAIVPEPAGSVCLSCGGPLGDDEKFCGVCGAKAGAAPSPAPAAATVPASLACPSCGASNDFGTKFCGACGRPMGNAPAAPKAAPAPAPAGGVRLCTSCGNPIQPGEKYCSKCLVMVKDGASPAPAAAPFVAPPPPPAPAPVPVPSGGTRVCKACGNPIQPGEKFCSKCLVTVNSAEPAMPAPVPVSAPPTESTGSYVCASCGSPLSGNEKFCGICGGPAVAARTSAPAPAGNVCPSCGAPVSATTKFCGGCGVPVGTSFPAGTVTPPASGEEVLGIIPNARKMKMMGMAYDTFTLVVTGRRMIHAQLTQAMLNSAIVEAQEKAKAEGKGFFGVWGDQLAASFGFAKRYETMPPDVALAETPGNVAIENSRITSIAVSEIRSNDDDGSSNQLRLKITSADGSFEYVIAEDDRFTTMLKNVYGDRVKLPFGLFKAGPIRIKFF